MATVRAMTALSLARFLIAFVPLGRWRKTLGLASGEKKGNGSALAEARQIARQIERGAERLPFETVCLPRAMAASWILRRREIAHALVFAVRPPERRGGQHALHAWIEVDGTKVIGDEPGPWIETLRLGDSANAYN
jgi:hypothetical protein